MESVARVSAKVVYERTGRDQTSHGAQKGTCPLLGAGECGAAEPRTGYRQTTRKELEDRDYTL